MLNPPLSNLSNELLELIVEELADGVDYVAARWLKRLSVVDRAFTPLCQSHLFKELVLSGGKSEMAKQLKRAYDVLKAKQTSPVSFVQRIRLELEEQKNISWLAQDGTLLPLMQILSKAPRPPYQLEIYGRETPTTKIPHSIIEALANSFFSASLESLLIWNARIPARVLLISSTLRRLDLSNVQSIAPNKPVEGDSGEFEGRRLPKLRELDYTASHDVVRRLLPNGSVKQVVGMSLLRSLRTSPEDGEDMKLVQPILDAAHETLEEIILLDSYVAPDSDSDGTVHVSFSGLLEINNGFALIDGLVGHQLLEPLLNLRKLHRLRVFKLRTGIYDSDPNRLNVVKDITRVLGTIPKVNNLALLYVRIQVYGKAPYKAARSQEWNAFAKEVAQISGGKPGPLRFELDMDTQTEEGVFIGLAKRPRKKLYDHIEEELGVLRGVEGVELEVKNELALSDNSTNFHGLIIDSNADSVY